MPVECVVITASDRVSAGEAQDLSGPVLVRWLWGRGYRVRTAVVPDGEAVGEAVVEAVADGAALVLTTGGTGIGLRDLTPEAVRPLLALEIPGILELVRARGLAEGVIGAPLTRGVAGVADGPDGRCVVITLPGSPGGCRDAVAVLDPLLGHLLAQARGGDHPRP